jgi:hypothetical protein
MDICNSQIFCFIYYFYLYYIQFIVGKDISDYSFGIYVEGEEGEALSSFNILIVGTSTYMVRIFPSINIIKRKRKKSTIV